MTEAGVNTVSFYSIDRVGNKEEVRTIEVSIDGIAPETVSNPRMLTTQIVLLSVPEF